MPRFTLSTALVLVLAAPAFAGDKGSQERQPTPRQGQGQIQLQGQGQTQGQQQTVSVTGAPVTINNPGNGTGGANTGGSPAGSGTSISNVGNTYSPNYPAASAYSMAYATFCINAQGVGAQAPWPLPGVSFSVTWMRDLCRWGHIAEMREKVGDATGAEWARCQISEYAEADKNGSQQCPQNRSKATTPAAASQSRVLNAGGLQCIDAAGRPVALGQPGAVHCQ